MSPKGKTTVLIVVDVKEEENESEVLTKDVVEVIEVETQMVETEVEIEIIREMVEIRIRVKISNLLLMNPNLIRRWRVIGENAKIKS